MSMILTMLSNHLLTIIENEIVSEEPAAVALVVQELELLVSKIEAFIAGKSAAVANVVDPVVDAVAGAAEAGVAAAGAALTAAVAAVGVPVDDHNGQRRPRLRAATPVAQRRRSRSSTSS